VHKLIIIMIMMIKQRNLWGNIFWIAFGLFFCYGGLRYGLWKGVVPGPGFLPFVIGGSLICLSLLVTVLGIIKRDGGCGEDVPEGFFSGQESWKRVLAVSAALIAYLLILQFLGFLITTFLFSVTMLRLGPKRLPYVLVVAGVLTLSLYILFKVLLHVMLPVGILGF
jgi:putative tricarboxylic transport membrane protein